MKDIQPILHSLGFLESEIETYLASLNRGPATVLELTKFTKLSRQATYVVIEQLTKRGLMSSVMRGKKKYYVAEEPEKLLAYAHRKEEDVKETIADLEHLLPELKLRVGGEKPVIKVFEGREGMRAVMDDIETTNISSIEEIVDLEARRVLRSGTSSSSQNKLKKMGLHLRGFYTSRPTGTTPAERYFLPKEFTGFKSHIAVYGDKVALFTFEGKTHSMVIESAALAKALHILFDLAFKGASSQGLEKEVS